MSALYESVPVPGELNASAETLAAAAKRAQSEYHLFVDEDYGWREWIWFPGLDQNEFAHWWTSEATPALRGEFFPAHGPLAEVGRRALEDVEQLALRIDGVHNTYLSLHKKYCASLLPRFAWSSADPGEPGLETVENTLLKWWKAIELTRTSTPAAFLWDFKTVCVEMKHYPDLYEMPEEVRGLIKFRGEVYVSRDWSVLPGLLPISLFEPETAFWEVNGEPFWGKWGFYKSALDGRSATQGFMRDEGRPIWEDEFLFILSFCPQHRVPALPVCRSSDGVLPDALLPTATYWLFDGALVALARQGYVSSWPNRGVLNADDVRAKGEQITEQEFRRYYATYAGRLR